MPLHLLGKKSWNPYAPAAIAQVRADEEAANAADQAYAERIANYEADKRLATLRGLPPPRQPSPPPLQASPSKRSRDDDLDRRERREGKAKRRRLQGEDDTDRDIRLARAEREAGTSERQVTKRSGDKEPEIVDRRGHIQLFAAPAGEKNAEAEADKARRKEIDEGGLRFKHAAGYKQDAKQRPWWFSSTEELDAKALVAVGDEEKSEAKERRDGMRMQAADPMAAMRQAQGRLREVERERELWNRERELELAKLREEQEREERRERRRKKSDEDELEGFSLDGSVQTDGRDRGRERRHKRHRSRSRDRKSTHHHRHRHEGRRRSKDQCQE